MTYQGSELEIFEYARNWKRYWVSRIAGFVSGDVLEVGAGIGANTPFLRGMTAGRWLCLEPDCDLLEKCASRAKNLGLRVETASGTVGALPRGECFDTALYIDVLEHIEDDAAELSRLIPHLRSGGHIIVLCPAHQGLFSEFDKAVGHFRRYTTASLAGCGPNASILQRCEYLDSVGYFLSLGNRMLLRQSVPDKKQILFWDRFIVPISRVLDRVSAYRFGKSVLAIWERK
jgi:SAM-dependent methyltransferase